MIAPTATERAAPPRPDRDTPPPHSAIVARSPAPAAHWTHTAAATMQGALTRQPACSTSARLVRKPVSRRAVQVFAKVVRQPGSPRVVRGTCYVTKDVRSRALQPRPRGALATC